MPHSHLPLSDLDHPSHHFFPGDFVWVLQRVPDRHSPVVLGEFLGKCAVEFVPCFAALSPSVPSPQVYQICCSRISRLLTQEELAFFTAHPECAELTRDALFAAYPHLQVVVKQE